MNATTLGLTVFASVLACALMGCNNSTDANSKTLEEIHASLNRLEEARRVDDEIYMLWFPLQIHEWSVFYSELEIDSALKTDIIQSLDSAAKAFDPEDLYNDEFSEALLAFGLKVDAAFTFEELAAADKRNWTKRCVKKYNKCMQDSGSDPLERKKCLNRYRKCLNKCKR